MRVLLMTVWFICCINSVTSAAILVQWDGSNGPSVSAKDLGSGIGSALDLTRGAGLNQATGGTFNSSGFTVDADLSAAIAANDYLSFGLSPSSGSIIDFSNIVVELDRSPTGPTTVDLFSNVDGFASSLSSFATPDPGALLTFDISALTGISAPIEFRIYGYGATGSSGTMDIEADLIDGTATGLQINGTVSAVPEPSSIAIVGLATGILAIRRRRKTSENAKA